jgi:hypothetical protein
MEKAHVFVLVVIETGYSLNAFARYNLSVGPEL